MLSLVALIVMLVATAASALPAESHEWYAGLRSPGRTYVAYGITAPAPPLGDSGNDSIVIAIAS